MEDSPRFGCRPLRDNELDAIEQLLRAGPRYQTLLFATVLRESRARNPDAWWYGALADGSALQAVLGIVGHSALVYGTTPAAIEAMAQALLKAQQFTSGAPAQRHQLFGDERCMAAFWRVFKAIERPVILDRKRPLFGSPADGAAAGESRAPLMAATPADARIVSEFAAEYTLEAHGVDPRRASREAHERRCLDAIAAGRQLIAKDGAKPVLIAEWVPLDERTVMLDKVFVPKPTRALPKLLGSVLASATRLPVAAGREVVFFAEVDALATAAEKAGFAVRATYHVVAMRG